MTEKDRKEAAALERRSQYEFERKNRIFNEHVTQEQVFKYSRLKCKFLCKNMSDILIYYISKIKNMLLIQIEEKKDREQKAKENDIFFHNQNKLIDERSNIAFSSENLERIRIANEVKEFNKKMMQKKDRKESDLEESPSKLNILNFVGEDLNYLKRIEDQKRQNLFWLSEQIEERKKAELDRINDEIEWIKKNKQIDECVSNLEKQQLNDRQRQYQEICQFNNELIKQKEDAKDDDRKYDEMFEHHKCFENLFKSEKMSNVDPDFSYSKNSKISMSQNENIAKVNENNLDKIQAIRICKKIKEQERERLKAEIDCQEDNRKLMVEQKYKKKYLNKILGSNEVDEEFFNQFNKSSR